MDMMNQRGHWVSWVIMAVITIVAAWILWNTSPMLNPNLPAADPTVEITRLLSNTKNVTETTPDLTFEAGRIVSGKDFNGYSPRSIVFDRDSTAADFISVGTLNEAGQKSSYAKNGGSEKFRAKATVLCATNGMMLQAIIESYREANPNYAGMTNPLDMCGLSDYQPCCLIVIRSA